MNRITIVTFFLLFPIILFAQEEEAQSKIVKKQKSGFEINFGYSLPMGKYQSTDISGSKSGYAGAGWMAQATFDWMGKHSFGLAIQYTFQKNQFQDAAKKVYPSGVHDSTYFLGPGSWSNNYVMFGPVFMTSFGKLEIDAKLLIGVVVSGGRTFATTNAATKQNDANIGTGFGYGISAGIGYKVSNQLAIKFNLNLLGGWPAKDKKYPSQYIGYSGYKDPVTGIVFLKPIYSDPADYSIKKVITTLNPAIGLVYHF